MRQRLRAAARGALIIWLGAVIGTGLLNVYVLFTTTDSLRRDVAIRLPLYLFLAIVSYAMLRAMSQADTD